MASVFTSKFKEHKVVICEITNKVRYRPVGKVIEKLPSIVWKDGSLWTEANQYLQEKAISKIQAGGTTASARSDASHLKAYADFLESQRIYWHSFPVEKYKRPTYMFRGVLIQHRKHRELAPTTVSNRISAVKRFYEWALNKNLLTDESPPYEAKPASFRYVGRNGFIQTKRFFSSDLNIPIRRAYTNLPEEGLKPISRADRTFLLRAINTVISQEFVLQLKLSFFSGMRIGTIIDLPIRSFETAFDSVNMEDAKSFGVGPTYGISTKDSVEYIVSMPTWLWLETLDYCNSIRRLKRSKRATLYAKDLVFITSRGNPYSNTSNQRQMRELRQFAQTIGIDLSKFHFHCARATFATSLVLEMMDRGVPTSKIVAKLMSLMGHTNASSSMGYIKFIEESELFNNISDSWSDKWQ